MSRYQAVNDKTLDIMRHPVTKEAGMHVVLVMQDGTKRRGVYQDLVVNPLNHPDHQGVEFIKVVVSRPERGLIVYLPMTQIQSIRWSLDEEKENDTDKQDTR